MMGKQAQQTPSVVRGRRRGGAVGAHLHLNGGEDVLVHVGVALVECEQNLREELVVVWL